MFVKRFLIASVAVATIFLGVTTTSIAGPDSAKGIIRSGQGHGVAMEVVDVTTGQLISPGVRFRNGQPFRLRFQTSMSGHLYLVNISPSGKRTQIFPQQAENNFYHAGVVEIPAPDKPPFQFDHESGSERIQVAISPNTIGTFERARYNPGLVDAVDAGVAHDVRGSGGFSNSNAAKGIIRSDGITFPDVIPPNEYFTFTVDLVHQ